MASQTSARGRAGPRAVLGMGFRDALSDPDGPRTHRWTPGPAGGIVEAENLFLVSFRLQIGLGFRLHSISRPPGGPTRAPGSRTTHNVAGPARTRLRDPRRALGACLKPETARGVVKPKTSGIIENHPKSPKKHRKIAKSTSGFAALRV